MHRITSNSCLQQHMLTDSQVEKNAHPCQLAYLLCSLKHPRLEPCDKPGWLVRCNPGVVVLPSVNCGIIERKREVNGISLVDCNEAWS